MTTPPTLPSRLFVGHQFSSDRRSAYFWIGPALISLLSGSLIGWAAALWTVNTVSNGVCGFSSTGCLASRLTGAGLGAALLFGAVTLAVALPRRIALVWCGLLAASALLAVAAIAV